MPLSMHAAALWALIICMSAHQTHALSPLKPPKTITGMLVSAYGDTTCDNQQIVVPRSTAQVAAAVKYYYSMQPVSLGGPAVTGGTPVKIRVISRARGFNASDGFRQMGFHERAGFACARSSQPGVGAVSLLMHNMRKVLSRNGATMRVQAGITLTELLRYATSQNLTVPLGVLPQLQDLTIGGLLATGAHGLGGRGKANVADVVKIITFVDGTGNITRASRNSNVGRGLVGGVGMLGVITEVTLQLKPGLSKMRSWGTGVRSDANFAQELLQLWDKYDNMITYWRPDLRQYKTIVLEEVPASAPFDPPPINSSLLPTGGVLHPQPDSFASMAGQLLAAVHSDRDSSGLFCRAFGSYILDASSFGWVYAYKQGSDGAIKSFTTDNGTGLINDMQSCNCDIPGSAFDKGSCFFNPNVWERIWSKEKAAGSSQLTPSFTVEEVEFPLNARDLTAFIADAKLMVASLAPGGCWPGGLLMLRTGFRTNDHFSHLTGKAERVMHVELGVFRPNVPLNAQQQGLKPRQQKKGSALQEYFEQLMMCKYKARPHWGKAWPRVFTSTACSVKDLYPASNWATQLSLQQQYDPAKMFETELLTSVLAGGADGAGGAACVNELSCYCKADADCGAAGLCCIAAPAALPAVKGKLCLPC